MSMMVSFVLSFFPRDVLDEILNLIESVSEDFPSYSQHFSPFITLCRFCQDFQLGLPFSALLRKEYRCQMQIGNSSVAYAKISSMTFQYTSHNPFEKTVEEGG